jgi:hypothetical protein
VNENHISLGWYGRWVAACELIAGCVARGPLEAICSFLVLPRVRSSGYPLATKATIHDPALLYR